MYDGGPAFASAGSEDRSMGDLPDGNRYVEPQEGMSLRDYFAAKAMIVVGLNNSANSIASKAKQLAENAYLIADAMLDARSKTKGSE